MTLEEFINLPDVVDIHMKYDEALLSFIEGKDYIRLGKVVSGNKAVVYVRENKINDVIKELGGITTDYFALTMGLLGTQNLETSRNIRSSKRRWTKLKRERGISRIHRYRNRLHKQDIFK